MTTEVANLLILMLAPVEELLDIHRQTRLTEGDAPRLLHESLWVNRCFSLSETAFLYLRNGVLPIADKQRAIRWQRNGIVICSPLIVDRII